MADVKSTQDMTMAEFNNSISVMLQSGQVESFMFVAFDHTNMIKAASFGFENSLVNEVVNYLDKTKPRLRIN